MGGQTNGPVKEGEIAREFNRLDEKSSILLDLLGHLKERLNPILREEPSEVRGSDADKLSENLPSAPVARSMRKTREKIEEKIEIVNNILGRLEL